MGNIYRSETAKFRELLLPFCKGEGIDIGFGGDPIKPEAITIDLEKPYAYAGDAPQHLSGDASYLEWFQDESFDYVYSSHLLEDFQDKATILQEWLRVLKPNGHLVLLLPDEKRFREHCERSKMPYNSHHADPGFSIDALKSVLGRLRVEIVKEYPTLECKDEESNYNFAIIARKTEEVK